MPREKKLSHEVIEEIVVLVSEHMMTQLEIAYLYGVAPATVSRAIGEAVEEGLIVWRQEVTEKVSDEVRLRANNRRKITPLKEALRELEQGSGETCLQELHVFQSGEISKDRNESIRRFARPTAAYLSRQLVRTDVKHLGISWGVALLSVLNELKPTLSYHPRELDPVICIPIAGASPEVEHNNKTSSANLAGALSRLLNGSGKESSSFSVGGWIPAEFSDRDCSVIRDYCFTSDSYKGAFGHGGTVHKLDCVLTSVGASKDFEPPWLKMAAKASKLSVNEFNALTVGNISGCFLPVPGLDARGRRVLESVNERWLGIQLKHLQNCAAVALRKRSPGVVVLAIGEGKAAVLLEAIKHKLVNIVCCDMPLMKSLEELCGQEAQSLEA